MIRLLSSFLMLTLLLTATACSEKKTWERSALQSRNVLSVLRDMTHAYEIKNRDSFLSNVADEYAGRDNLSQVLAAVFTKYEVIHLNIQYTKMLIMIQDKGRIKVSANWDADWTTSTGITQKSGGHATFFFSPDSFKLTAIEGKNPFIPAENPLKQ